MGFNASHLNSLVVRCFIAIQCSRMKNRSSARDDNRQTDFANAWVQSLVWRFVLILCKVLMIDELVLSPNRLSYCLKIFANLAMLSNTLLISAMAY